MPSPSAESTVDLALEVVQRRKWVGLVTFAVILSAAVPVALFLPDVYRATATVIVERQEAAFVRPTVTELETWLVTLQQELLSRARLNAVAERFDLYPEVRRGSSSEAVAARVRQDVIVEVTSAENRYGQLSTIGISISYLSLDPAKAAEVANALATIYVEENTDMRRRQAGMTAGFLKGELEAAQRELERQERRVEAFKARHTTELPQQISVNMAKLERLNAELRLNHDHQVRIADRRDKLLEDLARIQAAEGIDAEEISDPELVKLRDRLRELQLQFTERHPEVIHVKSRIAELERNLEARRAALETERAGVMAPIKRIRQSITQAEDDLARLAREAKQLQREIDSLDQRVQLTPQRERQLEDLERDYRVAKQAYDSLLARYSEAELAQSFERNTSGETFRILDAALPPTSPAAPNRIRLLMMICFLAIGLAGGALLLAEQLDTSFHTTDDVRRFTTVPVLASVPVLRTSAQLAARGAQLVLAAGGLVLVCGLIAWGAYTMARGGDQLVWLLARGQL